MVRFERGNAETERVPNVLGFIGLQNDAEFHMTILSSLFLPQKYRCGLQISPRELTIFNIVVV